MLDMIDGMFCRLAERTPEVLDPGYTPEQAVTGYELLNADAPRLNVLLPPWHGGGRYVSFLKQKLAARGEAVLAFDVHDQILEADADRVVDSYAELQTTVALTMQEEVLSYEYEQIHLVGMSLGTVALALVADRIPYFDSATIVVGSSNLALSMWRGRRTQHLRRAFEAQGLDADELDARWDGLAPRNYVDNFAGIPVRMIISMNDEFIPFRYQQELAYDMADAGAKLQVEHTRLGHCLAAGRYCVEGATLSSFRTRQYERTFVEC